MAAIRIEGVAKSYGKQLAVNNLSLEVPESSIYGFIGPNGSGKSTTLRMIMRIILPDRGRIEVLGQDSLDIANDRIGYLPEERGLYKKMTVVDVLSYHAKLKGIRRPAALVDEWLVQLGMHEHRKKKVEALSKGMAQKIQFIATVIAKPQLVILDEPFSGLDPVNRDVIRDAIVELRKSGSTIIFSTHDMNVAEMMCDYIFMIYKGEKVLDDTMSAIESKYASDTIRLKTSGGTGVLNLAGLPGVAKATDHGNYHELRLNAGADSQRILAALMERTKIEHFEVAKPSLHDIFVRIASPDIGAVNGV